MPEKKSSASSPKDVILSIVFVIAIVLGFAMVWVVDYTFAGNGVSESTVLFQSDIDTEFEKFTTTDNYVGYPYFNVTTNARNIDGGVYHSDELTPAYLGNNTWGVSVPQYPASFSLTHISSVVVMSIPNLENWVITNVKINMTTPPEDVTALLTCLHLNSQVFGLTTFGSADPLSQETNIWAAAIGTVPSWELDYDVPLLTALRIYDLSQNQAYTCFEFGWVLDTPTLGVLDYAQTFSVEITGQQMTGWTVSDSLALALGSAFILNIGVMVYMTDMVDIGPNRQDLPSRNGRRKR